MMPRCGQFCCIDEVVGQRLDISAVVHYGHSCLTSSACRLPILYVFGPAPLHNPELTFAWLTSEKAISSALRQLTSQNLPTSSQVEATIPCSQFHSVLLILISYDLRYRRMAFAFYQALQNRISTSGCPNIALSWSEPDLPSSVLAESPDLMLEARSVILTACGRRFFSPNLEDKKVDR
ncbi:unnamed protein product [Protopolystoma xenopodis]|uniref:Diphthamide biosynthesis protein 2 n=1 Tax=Protopolystoma xenopodis TaxID=117903 RepID=A0A3S5AJR9_9PLAT|nr:unnamed protein product [Protopolystoma xenopodis]